MKAVRMYAPRDLRVEEVDIPSYEADECLIKVMAVGVCGSDIPRVNQYGAHVSPIIVGHEFGGQIVKTGDKVTKFKAGDRVTCPPLIPCFKCKYCEMGEYSLCEDYDYYGSRRDGAFAQYIAVKEGNLLKLDDKVSYEDAATTDPCANALHSMMIGEFKPGDSVCVYGSGPIGLFAVQYAKIKGASKIIAVDVWEEKLEMAKKNGADVVINSMKEDAAAKVMEVTGGNGADIVIDYSGAPICQKAAINSAAKLGKVVFLGISHQGLELSEKEVDKILRRELSIKGSWNSFGKPFPGSDWTGAVDLYENHGMTAKDIISHRLSLDEAPAMFEKIATEKFFFSKIMFYPNGQE